MFLGWFFFLRMDSSRRIRGAVLSTAFDSLTFLPNRTPDTKDTGVAFCRLADYRNGGVFVGHYAGNSAPWSGPGTASRHCWASAF